MRIDRIVDPDELGLGADLFDQPLQPQASADFLERDGHHLLFAYDDDGHVIGMISGVETTHPDKGTEMFLYELGVSPPVRRRGVATALVRALGAVAQARGCYAMCAPPSVSTIRTQASPRGPRCGPAGDLS